LLELIPFKKEYRRQPTSLVYRRSILNTSSSLCESAVRTWSLHQRQTERPTSGCSVCLWQTFRLGQGSRRANPVKNHQGRLPNVSGDPSSFVPSTLTLQYPRQLGIPIGYPRGPMVDCINDVAQDRQRFVDRRALRSSAFRTRVTINRNWLISSVRSLSFPVNLLFSEPARSVSCSSACS
jgi:hypothetical protein